MCFRIVIRVGRVRRSATIVPEEWPYRHLRMLDRTRLIDRLILLADRFSLGLFPAMPGFHTDKKSQKEIEQNKNIKVSLLLEFAPADAPTKSPHVIFAF